MIADNAFNAAEPADFAGDVVLEIDVIESRDDGLAQEHLPLFLGPLPATAILGAAQRGDDGTGLVGEETFEIRGAVDVIETDLDHLDAALARLLNLRLHHAVTRSPNDGTNDWRLTHDCLFRDQTDLPGEPIVILHLGGVCPKWSLSP